jgi:hypothetical protein
LLQREPIKGTLASTRRIDWLFEEDKGAWIGNEKREWGNGIMVGC